MNQPLDRLVADNLDIWTSAALRKSGAGRGGGKRISLYGIERLRALILDLAVRGKLVPQDARDEPAGELLKRLGIRSKPLAGLPTGWAAASLSELGTFSGGITPSKGAKRFWGKGVPWVSPKDMGDLEVISQSEDEITQAALEETSLQIVPIGSLLMVARSGILRRKFPLATTAVECTINQDMKAFSPKSEVSARYTQVMLQGFQPRVLRDLVKRGMTVESLIFNDFVKAIWPLPPLAEQRRIVAKVDELMALCDALEQESAGAMAAHTHLVDELLATLVNSSSAADLANNWARLETHFDTLFTTDASIEALKQTILDLAVRGKLVEHDACDEAASNTLSKVAKARHRKIEAGLARKARIIEPLQNDLPGLPIGWVWTQLGIIAEVSPGNSAGDDLDVSFVPMALVSTSFAGEHEFEIRKWADVKKGFTHFAEGDLGLAKITPCFENGKAAIFQNLTNGIGSGTTELHVARPWSDDLNRRYLLLTMKTTTYLKDGAAKMTGTAGQKRVTRTYFEATPLPLPPLAEQHRIVAKVDELMALCDALKARLADAAQTRCHLADAITERAAA